MPPPQAVRSCSAAAGWVPVFTSGMAPSHDRSRCRLTAVTLQPARVLVGTSGYNYPEWRGSFYPEKFSTDKMLAVLRRAVPDGRDQLHVLPDARPRSCSPAGRRGRRTASRSRSRRRGASRTTRSCSAARTCSRPSAGPRARSGRSWRPCCFSCRRRSRRMRRAARVRRAAAATARAPRSSSATRRGSTPRSSTPARAQRRAVHRRQREAEHAGRDDRRLRLLPAARRGLSAGRHRTLGGHDPRRCRACRMCSSTSSTKSRASGLSSRAGSSRRWGRAHG